MNFPSLHHFNYALLQLGGNDSSACICHFLCTEARKPLLKASDYMIIRVYVKKGIFQPFYYSCRLQVDKTTRNHIRYILQRNDRGKVSEPGNGDQSDKCGDETANEAWRKSNK